MPLSSSSIPNTGIYLRKKPVWNAIVILGTLSGYYGGLILLLLSNGWFNALGVVLLTYSLVVSIFFAHEFMHDNIFRARPLNRLGGNIVLWLNGGCYARFRDLKQWHIAHHVKHAEFSSLDVTELVQKLPRPLRGAILTLEWGYFPAIAFLFQWLALLAPFWSRDRQDERLRVTILLLVRGTLFTVLGIVSLRALLLYFLSYTGMHIISQFMGSFFHTYDTFRPGEPIPKRDQTYEQTNTFSYVLSKRYEWLGLFFLNAGYHNAHHLMMRCPWHNLHELNRDLAVQSGQPEDCFIDLIQMVKNYHSFRLHRVLSGCGYARDVQGRLQPQNFYGCIGFSDVVPPV